MRSLARLFVTRHGLPLFLPPKQTVGFNESYRGLFG